ncbi:Predicted arabinose efflux permease, MFS family [Klenkia soli]|uniref:Predicted arabinose efflux permease, MFS family n=1 Tax=Klenkia soli TaxID=1052260 RepID=A0A1H0E4L3_9ACTN|nr:MFS transporter [Klenkia soli]SDN77289.1 Predicted arabinose efflux permease, MFS family [Klenkia soli]
MFNPFSPYGRIFAVPGARSFSFAGWLARVPMSSMGLGSVLMVAGETGSYGLAGAVSGTLALANAVGSPQWARGMDRLGQGRVLVWSAAVFLVLGISFAAVVVSGGPRWSWFVLAALTGASAANVGAAVRARWAHALPGTDARQTAFAFESVVDEVVFVVGPPTITFLAALIAPPVGFLVGLLVGVAGSLWLARQVATQPPAHARTRGTKRSATSVLSPTLVVVAIAYLAVGTVFGAMDVVVVGFAQEQGRPVMAGVALAAYAGGSLVSGLLYGIVRLPGTLLTRFVGCGLLFGIATQSLLLVGSLPWLVVAVFLAGLTIAPVLVAGMSLVESRVARAALNEGLTWTTTGLTVGVTAGAALAGTAVDAWGAQPAFLVPALGAASAGVLALVGGLLVRGSAPVEAVPVSPAPAPVAPVQR